jgi:hypothetical protein
MKVRESCTRTAMRGVEVAGLLARAAGGLCNARLRQAAVEIFHLASVAYRLVTQFLESHYIAPSFKFLTFLSSLNI